MASTTFLVDILYLLKQQVLNLRQLLVCPALNISHLVSMLHIGLKLIQLV
jgi:hypothetical protein